MTPIHAKTWIFWTQAIVFGAFSSFGLVFGLLFLTGSMKPANEGSGLGPGVALTIWGTIFLPIFALAAFNIQARSKPLIEFYDDSVEFNLIGASALDRIPLIPGVLRVAWLIVTGEGFHQQQLRIPRKSVLGVSVEGFPMAKVLVIRYEGPGDAPQRELHELHFSEAAFRESIGSVAATVRNYCMSQLT